MLYMESLLTTHEPWPGADLEIWNGPNFRFLPRERTIFCTSQFFKKNYEVPIYYTQYIHNDKHVQKGGQAPCSPLVPCLYWAHNSLGQALKYIGFRVHIFLIQLQLLIDFHKKNPSLHTTYLTYLYIFVIIYIFKRWINNYKHINLSKYSKYFNNIKQFT